MRASDAHNGCEVGGMFVHGTFPRGAEAEPASLSTLVMGGNLKAKTNGQKAGKLGSSRGHEVLARQKVVTSPLAWACR